MLSFFMDKKDNIDKVYSLLEKYNFKLLDDDIYMLNKGNKTIHVHFIYDKTPISIKIRVIDNKFELMNMKYDINNFSESVILKYIKHLNNA